MAPRSDQLPMPSAYFLLALREFGATAAARGTLLAGTGLAEGRIGLEITLGQQIQQVRNINRLEPPGWGLRLGSRFESATHGPVGFATASARTLGDSIAVIERFGHVRSPYFRFERRCDGARVALETVVRVPMGVEEQRPQLEALMLSLQHLVEPVLGRPMREACFAFAWPRPRYADDYRSYYHGSVRFGAARTGLSLPAAWLRLECPLADPVTYAESVRKLELLARRLEGGDHLAARVEQAIAASRDGAPSLKQVAVEVHVSTRTLIRRLRRAGMTYHELIDGDRRTRAETLLANRDLTVAEVSAILGYGDPANFGRACRRWFGMAPGRVRRELAASSGAVTK